MRTVIRIIVGLVIAAVLVLLLEQQQHSVSLKRDVRRIETETISRDTAQVRLAEADRFFVEWNDTKAKDGPNPDVLRGIRIRLTQLTPDLGDVIYRGAQDRIAKLDALAPAVEQKWERGAAARAKKIETEREQSLLARRKAIADELERKYLSGGMDATVTVEGAEARTLRIKYVLINRPFIYKLQTETDFLANMRALGFKKFILTDGYRNSWALE